MKMSLRKDERGLAQVALIALVVLVIAVIGLAAWQISKKDKNNAGSGTSTASKKEVQNQCESVIDDKDLCKFAAAMSNDDIAYTATLSTTTASDAPGSMTLKSDGKGNSEVVSNGSGFDFDVITLNNASYMKNSDGSWTKTPSSSDLATNPSESLKYNFTKDDKDDYKKVGKEACGNRTCFKYQFFDKTNTSDETFVWFDTKDYRLQKLTFKSSDQGTSEMSFTYGKVTISEPSPIKQ